MPRRIVSAGKVIGIAGVIVAPLAIHAAIATTRWTSLVVIIPVLQLAILGGMAVIRQPRQIKWFGAATVIVAALLIWAQKSGLSLNAMPGLPHALAYSALLIGFAISLLPGHEPVLTRVVVAVRGPLPADLIVHTRRVTWVWCFFFAGQLMGSALLFFLAPLEVWSFFINVLNLPLVALMFAAECSYRFFRFRGFPIDSFSDIMQIVAKTSERRVRQADSV
jgi:uncharacterized membrane protein